MNGAGAIAISVHESSRPPWALHASTGCSEPPPSTGAIPNRNSETAPAKKPAASSRSSRRPSTEKRAPARIATSPPASTMTVSSTVRSSGR